MRPLIGISLSLITLMSVPGLVQAQSVDELFRQGNAAQTAGDYVGAEALFRHVLRLAPDNATVYNKLGVALAAQEHYEEAEEAYREAIRLDPNNALAYYYIGNALAEQDRYGRAEAAYREAIRLAPKYANAYYNLGTMLFEQGRYREATAALRESIRLNSSFAFSYNNLGYLYQTQDRLVDAIVLYNQALAIEPIFTPAQNNLAEAERLLALRNNPLPSRREDLAWQPDNEPLQPILRSVVRVITSTPTGIKYGTGWVIKREGNRVWVLTNRHVVTQTESAPDETRAQIQAGSLSNAVEVDL
ncbi:MAG: tetratricopeptide repeat protein, partial [Cyanobacteria bacterium J06555_13]